MEDWVNILEFNKTAEDSWKWLLQLLDEEKILYKKEIKEYWVGRKIPKYEQKVILYIKKEYKQKVEAYLNEYNNSNNIIMEAEELKNISKNDDEYIEYNNKYKKILAWIPIVMLGIVIMSAILVEFIYK